MVVEDNRALLRSIEESRQLLDALLLGDDGNVPGQMVQMRDDQERNNAGGFVFQMDDLARIRRFLILGTDSGSYYVTEKELTIQNLEALIGIIKKGKGGMILREIVEISLAGRAPKQDPLLLALALCARYNVKDRKKTANENVKEFDTYLHELQQAALKSVHKVCRIPTHLFTFVKYCEMVTKATSEEHTGWGRAMRKCVSEWYLQRSPKELAMHLTKYRNRAGYSHRDLLRLAHPMASQNRGTFPPNEQTLVYDQLFKYACEGAIDAEKGKIPLANGEEEEVGEVPQLKKARCDYTLNEAMIEAAENSDALKFIGAVIEASKQKKDEVGEQRCVELIKEFGLVREHIPTDLLNSPKVWATLLEYMPMTALIRNLSKLSSIGLIDGEKEENNKYVDMVVSKVLDQQAIHRARIHPISVLLAASVYERGTGLKGSLNWKVNDRVKKALDECFTLAFKNVQSTKRRYCLALDISGSMSCCILGGALSCRTASSAMSSVFLRTEEQVECVAFETKLTELPFTKESSVTEMCDYTERLHMGGTDCALPMLWAAKQKREFDVFIVFTDSETWAGEVHPFKALKAYREQMNIPNAKLVVMGMASTEFTIADPNDPGMIDIVGLDSAVPELVRSFVLDEI